MDGALRGVAGLALASRLLQAPHIDRRCARPLLIHRRPEVYILPTHVESEVTGRRVGITVRGLVDFRAHAAVADISFCRPWLCFQGTIYFLFSVAIQS
jgi:hypothetical protein